MISTKLNLQSKNRGWYMMMFVLNHKNIFSKGEDRQGGGGDFQTHNPFRTNIAPTKVVSRIYFVLGRRFRGPPTTQQSNCIMRSLTVRYLALSVYFAPVPKILRVNSPMASHLLISQVWRKATKSDNFTSQNQIGPIKYL